MAALVDGVRQEQPGQALRPRSPRGRRNHVKDGWHARHSPSSHFQQHGELELLHPDLPQPTLFINLFFATVEIVRAMFKNGCIWSQLVRDDRLAGGRKIWVRAARRTVQDLNSGLPGDRRGQAAYVAKAKG